MLVSGEPLGGLKYGRYRKSVGVKNPLSIWVEASIESEEICSKFAAVKKPLASVQKESLYRIASPLS